MSQLGNMMLALSMGSYRAAALCSADVFFTIENFEELHTLYGYLFHTLNGYLFQ